MKFIKQSFEIVEQGNTLVDMFKHIEKAGRVCHKSEDLITDKSYDRFISNMLDIKHYSVLEHGTIYLKCTKDDSQYKTLVDKYYINPYSKVYIHCDGTAYITTNYRVIVENFWEEDLVFICNPTEYHLKRYTVLLHTCIHVYKDLTRHRKASFSIESTRYCNYNKDKYDKQLKFVWPNWINDDTCGKIDFIHFCEESEKAYLTLINNGWQAQQAAEVLPQCTAADVIITAFDFDWYYIFKLRSDIASTGKPHPLVEELMTPLREEFIKRNYITNLNLIH